MGAETRWLLVYAGQHLLAVPARQVLRLTPAASPAPGSSPSAVGEEPPVVSLAARLGDAAPPGELILWTGANGDRVGVRVHRVQEMVDDLPLLPLPRLLGRALPNAGLVAGMLVWQGRPLVAVDLARLEPAGPSAPEAIQ
ncbi:MAG: hypothetical protein GX774_02150 [Armatimonadetes bacterium]|nr:hypothetical protein [Armatimonadota bacterium]